MKAVKPVQLSEMMVSQGSDTNRKYNQKAGNQSIATYPDEELREGYNFLFTMFKFHFFYFIYQIVQV